MRGVKGLVLLICVMLLLVQGCAGASLRHEQSTSLQLTGLQPTGGEEAAGTVMVYAALGLLVVAAVAVCFVADLFCLPFSIGGHIPYFPCCRFLFDLF